MPDETEADDPESIYISNAGLVLLNPFIPALFERTGIVSNGNFTNEEKKQRGVHLLQYLANGKEQNPEYVMPLPKVLCGMELNQPLEKNLHLTKKEKEQANELLNSVLAHWKAMRNTSIEGLQESFLQRNGALRLTDDGWKLVVESLS